MKISHILPLVVGSAACILSTVSPAQAIIMFSGPYAPANWTLNDNGTGGSVNSTNAPTSIHLTSGNAFVGGNTDYTINAVGSGTWSFNWSYSTVDDFAEVDPFSVLKNGTPTVIFNSPTSALGSGFYTTSVTTGDVIGFRMNTFDGRFGAGTVTISNFDAPTPTPVPFDIPPGAMLTTIPILALVYRWKQSRSRIALKITPNPADEVVS